MQHRTLRGAILAGLSLALALSVQGCFFPPDMSRGVKIASRYCHDPRSLTQWVLRQSDIDEVSLGCSGLVRISQGREGATTEDRAWAVLGLWQIAARFEEGWPKDQKDWAFDEQANRNRAGAVVESDADVRAAFRRLGPKLSKGPERDAWLDLSTLLERRYPDPEAVKAASPPP